MIETTDSELKALWEAYHSKRRKGTVTQAVPIVALEHILKDHHTLYTALHERKLLKVETGPDQESLIG